ncbi:hypothetical protein ACWGTI_22795 [Mesorhizobium sp. ArgA1]
MPKYEIDEMRDGESVSHHTSEGETPSLALGNVVAGPFVVRTTEQHWFRVVDEAQSRVFHYATIAEMAPPPRIKS